MKNFFALSFFLILFILAQFSCKDEIEPTKLAEETTTNNFEKGTQTVLGEKVNNPYSLRNMQIAYDSISKTNSSFRSATTLEPTHYYVRFLPKDSVEYNILDNDTTLELFDYPLDYDIVSYGDSYHDPSLPESQITWQYTKVPTNYKFPNLRYEILDTLYIPYEGEEDSEESSLRSAKNVSQANWDLMVEKSMCLTKNKEASDPKLRSLKKWRPEATIKGYDDNVQRHVPLYHVKVRARNLLYWNTAYTDINGFASFPKARFSVSYSIVWENNSYWDIRDGWFLQAYYNGPCKKSSWNLNIGGAASSDKSKRYAIIHRALMRAFYLDNNGLTRPIGSSKLKICYINSQGSANGDFWGDIDPTGFYPDIRIYAKDAEGYRSSMKIFATTTHELAHAAHRRAIGLISFASSTTTLIESWASAVAWKNTILELAQYGVNIPQEKIPYVISRQSWPEKDKAYTPFFIDLMDDMNQHPDGNQRPLDNKVSGFRIFNLEYIVFHSKSLQEAKSKIQKYKPNFVKQSDLDNLLKYY